MGGLSKEEPALDKKADKLQEGGKDEQRNTPGSTEYLRQHEEECRSQKAKTLGDDAQARTVLAPNPKPHLLEEKILGTVRPLHRADGASYACRGSFSAYCR